jgi:anti-sigma regulatory factor (Ser/Thr protein kinase)
MTEQATAAPASPAADAQLTEAGPDPAAAGMAAAGPAAPGALPSAVLLLPVPPALPLPPLAALSALPPPRPPALPLPAEPSSAAASRRHVRRLLGAWGLATCVDTAQLLVSELVANAVTAARAVPGGHSAAGGPPIELSLRRTGTSLIIEVRDPNPDPPVAKRAGPQDEDGRGLLIVETLSRRWGHHAAGPGGKVVWCEITLPGGAPAGP